MGRLSALLVVALLVVVTSSCGFKPAQDYVVIGTLTVSPELRSLVNQAQMRGKIEVIMTARLTPDVGDVVIQRRWMNPTLPLEFGLGKSRFPEFEGRELYVTAKVVLPQIGALVGFSSAPIPAGTEFVELVIDRQEGDPSNAKMPGYPRGGFESQSVREEAVPPGGVEFSPGSRVFSGRVEVPNDYVPALRGLRLIVQARERVDRGAPELILSFDSGDYPQSFSLHQAHRIDLSVGSPEDAMKKASQDPILTPKFVMAQIDVDGNVNTKEDLFQAATATAVEVGTSDIVLRFDEATLDKLLEARRNMPERSRPNDAQHGGSMNHGGGMHHGGGAHHGGGTNPGEAQARKEETPKAGGVLVAGQLVLPPALAARAEGAELWFSIRDPKSGSMIESYRMPAGDFPMAFSLENGAGMFQLAMKADQGFILKAILTTGDVQSKDALVAFSTELKPGTKNLELTLAEQAQKVGEQ